jgi:hypothetical protein
MELSADLNQVLSRKAIERKRNLPTNCIGRESTLSIRTAIPSALSRLVNPSNCQSHNQNTRQKDTAPHDDNPT